LFNKRKVKLFSLGFFSSAKNSRFITNAGGEAGAQVIKRMFLAREQKKVEKHFYYYYRT
jgi:hypothetical protein